jgi:hypothetical protein
VVPLLTMLLVPLLTWHSLSLAPSLRAAFCMDGRKTARHVAVSCAANLAIFDGI